MIKHKFLKEYIEHILHCCNVKYRTPCQASIQAILPVFCSLACHTAADLVQTEIWTVHFAKFIIICLYIHTHTHNKGTIISTYTELEIHVVEFVI